MRKMKEAFFLLQPEDVDAMGAELARYSLLVINPAFPEEKLQQLRSIVGAGAIILNYDNLLDAPDPAWLLEPYWRNKAAILERRHLRPSFCWFGNSPAFVHDETSALALAEFHAVHSSAHVDGTYLDVSPRVLPPYRLRAMRDAGFNEAFIRDIAFTYQWARQFYTAALRREMLGSLLVANAAGWLRDPMLDGITIEVGVRFKVIEAFGAVNAAANCRWRGERDPIAVLWCRTDEERAAALQLQTVPWVYVGTIRRKP